MSAQPLRIVLVDNYDSYVYNLYQRIGELTGCEAWVVRNDATSVSAVERWQPTHVVISPGPGRPDAAGGIGVGNALIAQLGLSVPVLGVCLGHQAIGHVFGGKIVRAPVPMHGKTSVIRHTGSALFEGLPEALTVMRYHSLVIEPQSVPACLRVTATTSDGVIMAVDHVSKPIFGVQFHPESIGTPHGARILANFLERPAGRLGLGGANQTRESSSGARTQ